MRIKTGIVEGMNISNRGERIMKTISQAYLDLSLRLPIEDDSVQKRLHRAHNDVLNPQAYNITKTGDGLYTIRRYTTSAFEDNSVEYLVSSKSCTCPDFEKTRAGLCKHRLAVMLLEEMEKDTVAEQTFKAWYEEK